MSEVTYEKYRPFNEDELLGQIGRGNIFAISGGRVQVWRTNDGKATCFRSNYEFGKVSA